MFARLTNKPSSPVNNDSMSLALYDIRAEYLSEDAKTLAAATAAIPTVTAVSPITATTSTSGVEISTSVNANKLLGRGASLGGGVAEPITLGTGLSMTGTTLNASVPSGSALTKSDDTNVTMTLTGTPTSALLAAVNMALGWTGLLANSRGGTGLNSSASTGVAQIASGTWSASTALANGTTATTQAAADASTKVATTAYVDTAQALNLKIANNLSDVASTLSSRTNLGVNTFSDIYTLLGGTPKAYPIGVPIHGITTATTLTSQLVYVMLLELQAGVTYSGAIWWQAVKGNYTASNNNKIDVCSYSGGTLTQVATTGNDGTLWQTANTLTPGSLPFTGTFVAAANTAYFIRAIYSASATVTVPQIGFGGAAFSNNAVSSGFFTNSAKIYSILTAQTDLTTPQAMSAYTAASSVRPFIGLY